MGEANGRQPRRFEMWVDTGAEVRTRMPDRVQEADRERLAAQARADRAGGGERRADRQAIVPAVPTLSGAWWSGFNDKISTAIARATATPGPALAALP
jgi:hypothetical protein